MQDMKFTTVDQYLSAQPEPIRERLLEVRQTIKASAPRAEEVISYGMPAFKQNGVLVFYAAWKSHIGFYPSGSGIKDFEAELAGYKTSKGAIQFPYDQKLPLALITKIVKFRVKENEEKAALKALAKTRKR
jgi:uncharacterized protein YdhG (YjbR/CyaY superfamily)